MEKFALVEGGGGVVEMVIVESIYGLEVVFKIGILGNFELNYLSRSGLGIKDVYILL